MPRHVRQGDMVMVTSGDEAGQTGEVLRVIVKKGDPNATRVIVKGLNTVWKHQKPTRQNPQAGSKYTKEASLHISKVSPVVDGKPVRVGFREEKDGTKVRVARKGGKEVSVLGTLYSASKERGKAGKSK